MTQALELQMAAFREFAKKPEERKLAYASKKYEKATKRCLKAHSEAADAHADHGSLDEAALIIEERRVLLAPHDFEAKRCRGELIEWLPVGTTIRCHRTRSNGGDHDEKGVVTRNDGHTVVIKVKGLSGPERLWVFEAVERGQLRLSAQQKIRPNQGGGDINNCEGVLRVDKKGLGGKYAWDLEKGPDNAPLRVSGLLTFRVISRP